MIGIFLEKTIICTLNSSKSTALSPEVSIPSNILPIFNSSPIESYFNNISSLAEKFIYFNDDMYVMKPLLKSNFFTDEGKPIFRIEPMYSAFYSYNPFSIDDYFTSILYTFQKSKFPITYSDHGPYSLTKSMYDILDAEPYATLRQNGMYRFRNKKDFLTVEFLKDYHLKQNNLIVYKEHTFDTLHLIKPVPRICSHVKFVCINELNQKNQKEVNLFKKMMRRT